VLKKDQRRRLTDEQRERIRNTPGVVVHRRKDPPTTPFFEPRFQPRQKLEITASDLIDAEEDEENFE
jgi:hypothetical protein